MNLNQAPKDDAFDLLYSRGEAAKAHVAAQDAGGSGSPSAAPSSRPTGCPRWWG